MIQLTQSKIVTWQRCKRCFQLQYVDGNDWPKEPISADLSAVMEQGEIFHMLAAQSYLLEDSFAFDSAELEDPIGRWWEQFQTQKPQPKQGQKVRIESTLTAGITPHVKLLGRLDLLFLGGDELAIFDWKTGKSRSENDLKSDWQTRIYLALLAQSRPILGLESLPFKALSITYWYPRDPQNPVKIQYDEAWHETNWGELLKIATEIENQLRSAQESPTFASRLPGCNRCMPQAASSGESKEAPQTAEDEPFALAEFEVHPDL